MASDLGNRTRSKWLSALPTGGCRHGLPAKEILLIFVNCITLAVMLLFKRHAPVEKKKKSRIMQICPCNFIVKYHTVVLPLSGGCADERKRRNAPCGENNKKLEVTHMKKLTALLLALVTLLSLASFAGADGYYNETGYPICNEVIRPKAAGSFGLDLDYKEILTWAEWRERLGIEFEMMFYNSEDWKTQLTLMMASDEMPDILHSAGLSNAEMADYGSQGYFVNLLDYEELLPNLVQAWEDYPGLKGATISYDGNMYGTKYVIYSTVNKVARTFINNVWLENVGKEMPTTIDELYDVLVAFKEQDANGNGDATDEIPLGYFKSGTARTMTSLCAAFGFNTDVYVGYNIWQADEEGNVYLADTSDDYKAFLTFLNKCYAEGLLAEECFTLTGNEVNQLCADDKLGYYATGSAPFVMSGKTIDTDGDWSGVMGLTSEYNEVPTLGIPSGVSGSYQMVVSADSEYKEAMIRFIDYVWGEEGSLSTFSGYEGISFDYVYDEILQTDVLTWYHPEGYSSPNEFIQYKAVFNGPFRTLSGVPARNALWDDAATDILLTEEVMNEWGWMAQLTYASRAEGLVWEQTYPSELLGYTEDELNERTTLNTDIATYLEQAFANFIMGTWSLESDWETHLATLESMGLSRLMEIEQAAYDRYLGK